jgi:hypothetical protein
MAGLEDVVADLYELDDSPNKGPAPKRPEKPKDEKGRFVKSEEKNGKEEKPKPETKPEVKEEEAPRKIRDLRESYDVLKKRIRDEMEPELAKLRGQVKEYEGKQSETKPYQDRIEALEKELKGYRDEMRYVRYEKSPEYKDKYEKPFKEAWQRALHDFSQLTVRIADGVDDMGEPKYKSRTATADDLMALASMPLAEMDEAAERMFGKSSARVIRHVESVRSLAQAQEEAKANALKDSEAREKQWSEGNKAQTELKNKTWVSANKNLVEKFPKWFAPGEGDTEGNTHFQRGLAEADRLFSPKPETAPKTLEEAVQLHARIRNKAANHDRLAFQLKKASARIKELEKELEQYGESEPKGDKAKDTKKPTRNGRESYIEEIAALNVPGL